MSAAIAGGGADGKEQTCGDAARYEVCSEATSGWTRRLSFCRVKPFSAGCVFMRRSREHRLSGVLRSYKRLDKESRVSLGANLPIERRASNVYIRVIFDQFDDALYRAGCICAGRTRTEYMSAFGFYSV